MVCCVENKPNKRFLYRPKDFFEDDDDFGITSYMNSFNGLNDFNTP